MHPYETKLNLADRAYPGPHQHWRRRIGAALLFFCTLLAARAQSFAQQTSVAAAKQLVLIDTDIGDDIDDVFAVGLALSSPELQILGITSAWGDTELKARLLDRLLCETGRTDIP